jgi:hypothetical protein
MSGFYGGTPPSGSPMPNPLQVSTDPLNDNAPPAGFYLALIIVALIALRLLDAAGKE